MVREYIMQMRPFFGEEERQALYEYDFENGFVTEYQFTKKFEEALGQQLQTDTVCALNNGTIALTIAALAVGVEPGDEVIVPNFTMIATPNSVRMLGAKPVFADVDLETWCIDYNSIFEKITDRTKAVIIVAANGRAPLFDVCKLTKLLNEKGIFVIEDAAQSLGSTYSDGTPIGLHSNIATLSFSGPKIISTGQGGAIYSSCPKIMEKVKTLKDFGRSSGGNDLHDYFGVNCKFTELQAIIGLEQLKKLRPRIIRRKEQNALYSRLLSGLDGIIIPKTNYDTTVPWFTEILVDKRDYLSKVLHDAHIGTRPVYPEVNKQLVYNKSETLVNSQKISRTGLWLPSHMGVTDDHIEFICEQISLALRH